MRSCLICYKKLEVGNVTAFRVPKDVHKREKWSKICRKTLTPSGRICIDHFSSSDIITAGQRLLLLPCAVPVVQHEQIEVVASNKAKFSPNILKLSKSIPPQLQEEPIVQVPFIKSVCCTTATQTNTRLCGLVQASAYSDELRLICFYCPEVFPLDTWKTFVDHIKQKHFEREEAFKAFEYVSNDHDYTPINLPSPPSPEIESFVIKTEAPFLEDPLQPVHISTEPENFNYTYINAPGRENKLNNYMKTHVPEAASKLSNFKKISTLYSLNNSKKKIISKLKSRRKNLKQQTSKKTALNRCLKRTDSVEVKDPQENVECNSVSIEIIQQNSTEIAFEYAPRDVVDLLLDSMKNYEVLWQFDEEPFNQDFFEAVEELCKIINDKWALNIDNLKMRRSINRILRYYCYLYPNSNVENVDQFTNYYDKCATFLPSSIHEITYARCSHCYICYKNDFDLKRHLLEEQKYLQWPFKCSQCKECFRESDDYELHKRLPHYDEVFRCETCSKRFDSRNNYNKHVSAYHPKVKSVEFKCNICSKVLQSNSGLRYHQLSHGERKFDCHLCPKNFYSKARLTVHLKIHEGQFDYVCEVCGKAFIFRHGLIRHMKKHTGAKVSCNICNLKLRKSSLRRHLRVVHKAYGDTGEKPRLKDIAGGTNYWRVVKPRPVQPYQRTFERNYKCKICKINFNNYKLIVEHNKELHFDKPKWPCKMCCTEFSHSMNLKRHYRRKHNLHAIQAFKVVNEKEDLDVVLNMKEEFLNELTKNLLAARNKPDKLTETKFDTQTKQDSLSDDVYFETTMQDEILKTADNIAPQENKINYINDLFTDLLKE